MAKLALTVFSILLLTTCVQGCGLFAIKCKVEEFINKEASQVIGQAKEAFEQAMDYLFDNDISPLIDKVQAAIDAGINKVNEDVNQTINHVESAIELIIQDAAQTANEFATNVTEDIEQIISKAATAIIDVEQTFYRDASNLLSQINQIVQKGQCMEASAAKQIQNQIYKLLNSLDPHYRFSSCWRDLGYKRTMSLEDLTTIQLYNFQKKCTLLNKITPTTPIQGPGGILQTYAQGQLYAAQYYCIGETANAPAFQDVMTKEWLWWGVQYNAWNTVKKNQLGTEQDSTIQRLGDDPSCGTPVECYAKAIEALKEAESKINGLNMAVSGLNQTLKQVIGNQTQLKANMSANIAILRSNISANNYAITYNKKSITDNKNNITSNSNNISSNSARFSSLTTYPCNCANTPINICHSKVSQGFGYYCEAASCKDSWSPVIDSKSGLICCDLCTGTAEEAKAYALANPIQPAVHKEKDSYLGPLRKRIIL